MLCAVVSLSVPGHKVWHTLEAAIETPRMHALGESRGRVACTLLPPPRTDSRVPVPLYSGSRSGEQLEGLRILPTHRDMQRRELDHDAPVTGADAGQAR